MEPFNIDSRAVPLNAASPWDENDQNEIVEYVAIDSESCLNYYKQRAQESEGFCFDVNNLLQPWRWRDQKAALDARFLAVSNHHVMYAETKYSQHVLNPCPPCCCCLEANYKEDISPKTRKMIPFEKITDVEVEEAGSNELVAPSNCCCYCPPRCNPVAIEIPVSKTMVNTAGTGGVELIIEGIQNATKFRRLVMELKKGSSSQMGDAASAPRQMAMSSAAPGLGGNSEVVALLQEINSKMQMLQDIAGSNRQIVDLLQEKSDLD